MSLLKKNRMIVTYNYKRYNREDSEFILVGLRQELNKKYGLCFDITLEEGDNTDVKIVKRSKRGDTIKLRAIQMKVRKHLIKTGSKA